MLNIDSTPFAPLLGNALRRHFPKGQIILYQGDSPQRMYILRSGQVKMYDIDEQGNEKIVHILRPPSIFPFASYFRKPSQVVWFYSALSDTETYALAYEDVTPQMQHNAELTSYLLEQMALDMHELFVRISSMNKTDTGVKLIAALKFLGTHHARPNGNGWRQVDFPVSHQLLADMTGITRESATLAMQDIQKRNLTRSPKLGILEINYDKLVSV